MTIGDLSEIGQFSLLEGDGICEGPSQKGEGTTRRRGEGLDFCMTSDFPRIKMYQMCQVYSDSKRLGNRMIFKQAFRSSNETLRTNRLHGRWMELGLPSQWNYSVPVSQWPPARPAHERQQSKANPGRAWGLGPVVLIFQGFWDMKKTWTNPGSFAQKIGGRAPPKGQMFIRGDDNRWEAEGHSGHRRTVRANGQVPFPRLVLGIGGGCDR